jgi:glutaminyl-tRNA synthetase
MKNGEFEDGTHTLRAKIDMTSPNMNLRDPVMYRILRAEHHRQGNKWCIYPMYDWAHGLEDSIEGITHSLCSLEYEIHRPLYEWFLNNLDVYKPRQVEFARLNLTYTVMSKRKFIELVNGGYVAGYDDPRLSTLAGLRRRGYTPEAIYEFCRRIGIAKTDSLVDYAVLEDCIREDLNKRAPRVMAVLNPLKVVIDNYPEGKTETLPVINNPEDPEAGTREVPFGRELYIERDDFMEDPPKKYFRLKPEGEVRLKGAYIIKCENVVHREDGSIDRIECSVDLSSRSGSEGANRKVKGTLHWVSAADCVPAEVRLYDRLFNVEDPGDDYEAHFNPESLVVLENCMLEGSLRSIKTGDTFQFMRQGYFCADKDSTPGHIVLNRTVALNSSWK